MTRQYEDCAARTRHPRHTGAPMDTDAAIIQCLALFEAPQNLAKLVERAKSENRALTVDECTRVLLQHQAAGEQFTRAVKHAHPDDSPSGYDQYLAGRHTHE